MTDRKIQPSLLRCAHPGCLIVPKEGSLCRRHVKSAEQHPEVGPDGRFAPPFEDWNNPEDAAYDADARSTP